MIPTRRSRKERRSVAPHLYRERDPCERFWARVKQYRRVATRYDKTAGCYLAFVHLASVLTVLRNP